MVYFSLPKCSCRDGWGVGLPLKDTTLEGNLEWLIDYPPAWHGRMVTMYLRHFYACAPASKHVHTIIGITIMFLYIGRVVKICGWRALLGILSWKKSTFVYVRYNGVPMRDSHVCIVPHWCSTYLVTLSISRAYCCRACIHPIRRNVELLYCTAVQILVCRSRVAAAEALSL